jgi:hypothetical protein
MEGGGREKSGSKVGGTFPTHHACHAATRLPPPPRLINKVGAHKRLFLGKCHRVNCRNQASQFVVYLTDSQLRLFFVFLVVGCTRYRLKFILTSFTRRS